MFSNFFTSIITYIVKQQHDNPWWYVILFDYLMILIVTSIVGIANRIIFSYGKIIKQRIGKMANPKYALDMFTVSGDFLAEIIHEEMFGEEGNAYLKHGISLPSKFIRDKAPALVIDVGSNVGLFGMAMNTFSEQALSKGLIKCREPDFTSNINNAEYVASAATRGRRSASNDRRTASTARKSSTTSTNNLSSSPSSPSLRNNNNNNNNILLPAIRVIGFEPIPETYECCRRNWDMTFKQTNQAFPHLASSVYQYGIGSKSFTASFFYDATTSAAASMSMSDNTKPFSGRWIEGIGAWLRDVGRYRLTRLRNLWDFLWAPIDLLRLGYGYLLGTPFFPIRLFFLVLFVPVLIAMIVYRVAALPASKRVDCQIITLPEALKRAGVDDPNQSIAFLKIDVEGAEEDVCVGIDDVTWARVHQAVIEVHDTPDGRVKRICSILKKQGFKSIAVDDEPLELHRMANIRTIFATRG